MFFDVTDLPAAEAEREELLDQLARLEHVTSSLCHDLSPSDVIRTVITQATTGMGASVGMAAVLCEDGLLHHAGSQGYPPEVLDRYDSFPLDADNLLAAAAKGRAIQVCKAAEEVLHNHPSLRAARAVTHSQAVVALPLIVDQRLLGVLGFSFREPRSFTEREIAFFRALADQCAQALDRAEAYRRLGLMTAVVTVQVPEPW